MIRALFAVAILGTLPDIARGATVTAPTQPKKTFTKPAVAWPTPGGSNYAFAITCSAGGKICASVTPTRLASKFTWTDPSGVLSVSAGTDPTCNGGNGGFLTIQGPSTCSPALVSIAAKFNGKTVSAGKGVIFDFGGTFTPDDNFTGRSQDRYGIAETAVLGVTITPQGITANDVGGLQ